LRDVSHASGTRIENHNGVCHNFERQALSLWMEADETIEPKLAPAEAEARLVLALRCGKRQAFDEAYALHRHAVFAFLLRLCRKRDLAEDLHQETWVKLAQRAATLLPDTRLLPWLLTVARNGFLSQRRWAFLDITRLFAFGAEAPLYLASEHLEERTAAKERLENLEIAIQKVSQKSREILLLIATPGVDQEDLERVLEVKPDAARQRLARARKELSEAMQLLNPVTSTMRTL
jgi:RNA polymerase sigma factor (sigma-70 family)